MQFSTFAIAAAAMLSPMALASPVDTTILAPVPLTNPIDTRASAPAWTISKFGFCQGDNNHEYSFNIHGAAIGETPEFFATCLGNSGNVFLGCQSNTIPSGVEDFTIFAKTKIINGVPQLLIETWAIANGCKYVNAGSAKVPDAMCASKKGSKFDIVPTESNNCDSK